jgi:hypothetical protein
VCVSIYIAALSEAGLPAEETGGAGQVSGGRGGGRKGVGWGWGVREGLCGLGNVVGRWMRAVVHVLLVCFILSKSAAPLKELFGPAPWLHYYDDYFFVNAQGCVFGFIIYI